jgi:uncharacterized protein (DUF4415 family)
MKRRMGVTKARRTAAKKAVSRKIARLRASAGDSKRPRDLVAADLYKPIKKPVTLRLDADVLDWLKKQGGGYQTRINRALRSLMMDEREDSGE